MRGRVRATFATLTSPPWRRAPWLLWRRAGVMAMVAGAGIVLVTPVAAVPLFLSSVGTAAVTVQADDRCPRDTGASYTTAVPTGEIASLRADPLRPLADDLGPTTRWMRSDTVLLAGAEGGAGAGAGSGIDAVVVARDGATDHIDVVEGTPGPGAWVTDRAARDTDLAPGDVASIGGAAVPVTGVYRDLAGTTLDDVWCAHADILKVAGYDPILPPPVVIVDGATFAGLMTDLGVDQVGVTWEAPLRPGLTVTGAEDLVDDLACASPTWTELDWCANGRPSVAWPGIPVIGPIGGVSGAGGSEPVAEPSPEPESPSESQAPSRLGPEDRDRFVTGFFETHLPFVIDRAGSIRTSVAGGVWPVAGCAALAGVGFVAAAGALWSDRRRREVTLLTVRGVSPAALGLKAVLELIVPLAVGAVAGVGLAYGLVRWLGPSPVLEPAAVTRAVASGAIGLAVAMLTVGVVVARQARVRRARWHHGAWGRLVPWELALAAVTVVSYRRLGEWGVPVSDGAEISRVDPLGLLFPVLFLLTAVGVAARLLLLGLRPLRAVSRRWPTSLYLAVRRVSRYRVAVVGLVAASAVAAGVLGYAATLNRSLDATLDIKARAFVGSDVAVMLTGDERLPRDLAARATDVDSFRGAWIETGGRRTEITVLAIDPATFAGATFWDATFSDRSLAGILDDLTQPARPAAPAGTGDDNGAAESDDDAMPAETAESTAATRSANSDDGATGNGAEPAAPADPTDDSDGNAELAGDRAGAGEGGVIPAVVTGFDDLPDNVEAGIRTTRTSRFTIDQVADVQGFPGMRRPTPTVFVAAANLEAFDLTAARRETWIRGDRDQIIATLNAAGTGYVEARQAGEVVDRVSFLTVAWTFDFVQAIAIAAGLLVIGGVTAYLDARRRNRILGYAFARRMGLTAGQHRLALLAELGASVVVGCWLGLGIALTGAWLAHGRIDPVPDYRPDPVLRPATAVIVALAVAATLVAVVAAALAQRRADGDSPVDVLRAGT